MAEPERDARFRLLFAGTYVDLLRFVERRAHPSHAEDVVAEAYLVAWRRIDQLPTAPADARAWLFGVARGCLLNQRRGEQRRHALAVRIADVHDPGSTLDAEWIVRRLDLARAWERLSAVHQEALSLTVWDGLDSRRAADVLGISPVAFRLRLSRARRALRLLLEHMPEADELPIVPTAVRSTP